MNKEEHKKSNKPVSNFQEPQPKGKVPEGDKAVKKPEDQVYQEKPATSKAKNPAKQREESEQPVHAIKKAPKNS